LTRPYMIGSVFISVAIYFESRQILMMIIKIMKTGQGCIGLHKPETIWLGKIAF